MKDLSVVTIVRNRDAHLQRLIEGLCRSACAPDELIIVDMSDLPITAPAADYLIVVDRFAAEGLPLAAARNRGARLATSDRLVFLDVDCIPLRDCIGRLAREIDAADTLCCADIRYLPPGAVEDGWSEQALLVAGAAHPVREFPVSGVRRETNAGLFWSLAFAIRRARFESLGGFDEHFVGYGAEDTDFGFRAAAADVPLLFVGGAVACHQYHDSHEPPVQHLADIVVNARTFRARWNRWPMEGWLSAFSAMGLIDWTPDTIRLRRLPTAAEVALTRA